MDSPKNLLSTWDNFHSVPAVTVHRLSHYQLTVNGIIQDIINDRVEIKGPWCVSVKIMRRLCALLRQNVGPAAVSEDRPQSSLRDPRVKGAARD